MALSFDEWKKKKKELKASEAKQGSLSFEDWKKAKELNIIDQQPAAPTAQTQQPSRGIFTKKDPEIVKTALKDFVYGVLPGSRQIVKTATAPNKMEEAKKIPGEVGGDLVNMVKGIAGLPLRTAATGVDAYKTSKAALLGETIGSEDLTSLKYPIPGVGDFVGEQPSMQKGVAQNLEAGASGTVAAGLGAVQGMTDYFLGKGVVKGVQKLLPKKGAAPAKTIGEMQVAHESSTGMNLLTEMNDAITKGDQAKIQSVIQAAKADPKYASYVPTFESLAARFKPKTQIPAEAQSLKKPIVPEAPKNYTDITDMVRGKKGVPDQYKVEKPYDVKPEVKTTIPKDYGEKMRLFITGKKTYEQMLKDNEAKPGKAPKVAEVEKPLMEMDSIVESPTETKWQGAKKWFTKNNPLSFESDKIQTYGKSGQELVTRVRRAWAKSVELKEEYRQINQQTGITKFTPDELTNLRDAIEKGAVPVSERVANAAVVYKDMFKKGASLLEIPEGEQLPNYFHRKITKEGLVGLGKVTETSELAKSVAKSKGISITEAVDLLRGSIRKAGAERSRLLPDELASQIRETPLNEILHWQEDAARRVGVVSELGKDAIRTGGQQLPLTASRLIDDMVSQAKNPGEDIHIRKIAGEYVDKIIGRSGNYSDMQGALRFLKSSMVVSKLNPATALANSFQGLASSWGDYGVRGLLDTMNKSNDVFINKLGFNNLKKDISGEAAGQVSRMDKFTSAYLKGIGMDKTEQTNFMQAARSTIAANKRAFEALKKNPNDKIARAALEKEGMFIEPGSLEQALKNGAMPDSELAMGTIEGVRRKMFPMAPGERPAWAATPVGSTAYIFHNYLLSQLKLISTWPVHRQILYYGIIAPTLGVPPLILRRVMQGKELPQSPEEWFLQAAQSGPGTPFDAYKTVSNPEFLSNYITGGFSPVAEIVTADSPKSAIKGAVRGFVPGGSTISNWMFPKEKK